ncbi:hypothetical protein [Hymenobacter sp.]|uniref:hypothetical protein n=1 Tax=Hymenobacter sp. TaxID=1898978 RepID=UPI00286C0C17|nr:hypothetical protein [Hymenobacter sp.]
MPLFRRLIRTGLCCLALAGGVVNRPARGQPSDPLALNRPVRLPTGWVTLAHVLDEASRQSKVSISYSSTRLATSRRVYLPAGPPRPLRAVLSDVLGAQHIDYGLLSGQVVLWPARQVTPPGVTNLNGRPTPAEAGMGRAGPARPPAAPVDRPAANPAALARAQMSSTVTSASEAGSATAPRGAAAPRGVLGRSGRGLPWRPAAGVPGKVRAAAAVVPAVAASRSMRASRSVDRSAYQAGKRAGVAKSGMAPAAGTTGTAPASGAASATGAGLPARAGVAVPELTALVVRAVVEPGRLPGVMPLAPLPASAATRVANTRRLAQVGLVYPLSTNGRANARTINGVSVNLLAGYAAGVRAVEVGGLVNVVRDSVRGFQAAGLLNVTGTGVRGVQLAGLANLTGGAVSGLQGAGLLNAVRDDARGIHVAGLLNVAGGAGRATSRPDQPTRVRRWLGQPRRLATDPLAQLPAAPSTAAPGPVVQVAGLANLTGMDVQGLQTASVLNVARRVRGVQFGLVNVARHVRGVQFGLINVADSVDGVALGLVNIVRHGYLKGEVWASESLPLNAVVKLGVRRYYTVLGAAAEPFGNRVQWAAGFGIGTAGRPRGRFTLSLDVVQWTLAGSSDDFAEQTDARLLTQLRPALAWQIEREGHLQLVVAPTLNLAIAWRNDGQPAWDFGANQLLFIDTAGGQSRTRLWPGLQVGLRF